MLLLAAAVAAVAAAASVGCRLDLGIGLSSAVAAVAFAAAASLGRGACCPRPSPRCLVLLELVDDVVEELLDDDVDGDAEVPALCLLCVPHRLSSLTGQLWPSISASAAAGPAPVSSLAAVPAPAHASERLGVAATTRPASSSGTVTGFWLRLPAREEAPSVRLRLVRRGLLD